MVQTTSGLAHTTSGLISGADWFLAQGWAVGLTGRCSTAAGGSSGRSLPSHWEWPTQPVAGAIDFGLRSSKNYGAWPESVALLNPIRRKFRKMDCVREVQGAHEFISGRIFEFGSKFGLFGRTQTNAIRPGLNRAAGYFTNAPSRYCGKRLSGCRRIC